MDWVHHQIFATINGVDIALWVLAYGTWRALVGSRVATRPAATTTRVSASATRPAVRRPVAAVEVTDRWARRAERLARYGRRPGRTQPVRRISRRAA